MSATLQRCVICETRFAFVNTGKSAQKCPKTVIKAVIYSLCSKRSGRKLSYRRGMQLPVSGAENGMSRFSIRSTVNTTFKRNRRSPVPSIALISSRFLTSATVAYGMNATLAAEARRGRARPVEEVEAVEVEEVEALFAEVLTDNAPAKPSRYARRPRIGCTRPFMRGNAGFTSVFADDGLPGQRPPASRSEGAHPPLRQSECKKFSVNVSAPRGVPRQSILPMN
jgi:hypothetical protein